MAKRYRIAVLPGDGIGPEIVDATCRILGSVARLEGFGLEVIERVPIRTPSNPRNERYLKTKKDKLGHLL